MALTPATVRLDACWKGYVQVGMKRKGKRRVPNCVPTSSGVTKPRRQSDAETRMDPRGSKVAAMEAELAKQAAARGLTRERAQAYIYGTLNKMGYKRGSKTTRKGATKAKRTDGLTPATLRLDLKCGKGAISEGEKCTKGPATKVEEKPGEKDSKKGELTKQRLVVGYAAAYATLTAAGLYQMRNMRKAYGEKFDPAQRYKPFTEDIGGVKNVLQEMVVKRDKTAGPSLFGDVVFGTHKGKNVVAKTIGGKGAAGAMQIRMMEKQGVITSDTSDALIKAQQKLQVNEVQGAQLAGKHGFGPKLVAAGDNTLITEAARGRPLTSQDRALRYVQGKGQKEAAENPAKFLQKMAALRMRGLTKGTEISNTNKARIVENLARMHTLGVAHNDLHPGNVFISSKGAEFIDYGTSERGGSAVASEFVRLMNKPRFGLQQAGGMGYNLKTVNPTAYKNAEREIKKAIGKRVGSLTSADIRKAVEKSNKASDLEASLQNIVDKYYEDLAKASRSDAALTPASLRLDLKCGKGAISEGEKCTKGPAQRVQPKKGPRNYAKEIEEQEKIMQANDFSSWRKANKLRKPTTQGAFDKQSKQYAASKQGATLSAAWKKQNKLKKKRTRRNMGYAMLGGAAAGLAAMTLAAQAKRSDAAGVPCGESHIPRGRTCHKKGGGFPTRTAVAAGLTAAALGAGALAYSRRRTRIQPIKGTALPRLPGSRDPDMPLLPGITPRALLMPARKRKSKTQRMRENTAASMRTAEKRIAQTAREEVRRLGQIGNTMAAAGEAAGNVAKTTTREVRLRAEAARRRFEPGYRRPDQKRLPESELLTPLALMAFPDLMPTTIKAPVSRRRKPRGFGRQDATGGPVLVSSKTDLWATGFDAEDGKKYTKIVTNPKTGRKNKVRYGAKGYRIAPGTRKGDRYCARSFGDMKSHSKDCSGKDRNTPLCLSRAEWRCSGKVSRRDGLTPAVLLS